MLKYDLGINVEAFSTESDDRIDFDVIVPTQQVHGTKVVTLHDRVNLPILDGVDALITNVPGLLIGVKTADCVPILLNDKHKHVVGAVHSGWKGTYADIITVCIDKMKKEFRSKPEDLSAVIGPCIHIDAFEVGDELYDLFSEAGYSKFCKRLPRIGTNDSEQWHIDLPGICRQQLIRNRVQQIELRSECTYSLFPRFHSARRMKEELKDHRILNCIKLRTM